MVQELPDLKAIAPPDETGATFEANSALKALYYSAFTGELVLSDDSGLAVDALNGAPGVYSARYAGPDASDEANNRRLLRELEGVTERSAQFVSLITLARQGQIVATAYGIVEGTIVFEPKGNQGFGYDPLFFYPPFNATFGQVSDERKLTVSARGQALASLLSINLTRAPAPAP